MATSERHFILATAGHVDHGKSALVKALTGTDPDRLPEEKARGITIDLGFAHLELSAPAPAEPATVHLGIVDVPGHEDFVKNMVAGVGSIDLALFVVAADDGWMPQSEEHLQILSYLGLRRAVVALMKSDLIEPAREVEAIAGVREALRGSPFADAPVVPTSVLTGRGLPELRAALARVLTVTPPPRDFGKPRLPIDRVFTLRGIGTVVTGTLTGGPLRRGQAVVIQPSGRTARLRSVQSYHHDVAASGPGTRTALNLPDLEAAAAAPAGTAGVRRGEIVTASGLGAPSETLDVLLEKSARLGGATVAAARPLKEGALVRVHHGSGNFPARVCFIPSALRTPPSAPGRSLPTAAVPAEETVSGLAPGQQALAQLRAETPVFAFIGDHFIVRDWAEQTTLAGGVVLDADADRRRLRSENQRRFLERRAAAFDDLTTLLTTQLARDGAVVAATLLLKSHFSVEDISGVLAQLVTSGRAVRAGDWAVDRPFWQGLWDQAAAAIDAAHGAHPERLGLALADLRTLLAPHLPAPELFELLVAALGRNDFAQAGAVIRRAGHRPALPPRLQTDGARIRTALAAKPFEPPPRKALAPDAAAQESLRFLLQTGEAVEVGADVVMLAEHWARAAAVVREFLQARGRATASELRQALGTSRRVIIPLLERLDREGVTAREGDQRVLRPPAGTNG